MAHLGTLTGLGCIAVGDRDVGTCRYRLSVHRRRGLVEVYGKVETSQTTLGRLVQNGQGRLALETGGAIAIVPKSWDWTDGACEVVSGPSSQS